MESIILSKQLLNYSKHFWKWEHCFIKVKNKANGSQIYGPLKGERIKWWGKDPPEIWLIIYGLQWRGNCREKEAINMQKALAYVSKFNVEMVMCPNSISIWHKSQISKWKVIWQRQKWHRLFSEERFPCIPCTLTQRDVHRPEEGWQLQIKLLWGRAIGDTDLLFSIWITEHHTSKQSPGKGSECGL